MNTPRITNVSQYRRKSRSALCPCRPRLVLLALPVHAAERLLIKNGTLLTMAPGQETGISSAILPSVWMAVSAPLAKGRHRRKLTAAVHIRCGRTIDLRPVSFRRIAISGKALSAAWVPTSMCGAGSIPSIAKWQARPHPEDFYWYTLHGSLDHLLHGITSVYNFTYGTRGAGEFAQQQWRGEIDSGVRFIHSYARSREPTPEEQRAELKAFIDYAKPDMEKPTVLKMSLAGGAGSLADVRLDLAFMKEFGLSNETHYLEWPLQQALQQANFANMVDAGILGPDLAFGHFIHTTEPMLKAVAAAGTGMVWNPLSNGRLASGIADIPKYLSLGVKVGMGVDGQASADLPDPFENMRMGLYMIRAKYESAMVMQPIDVLRLHTIGGAEVLGVADKVGSLEVGKFGDILVLDPRSVDRAPVFDPYATFVFACNVMNLERVYVGGDLSVENRKPLKHDYAKISTELATRVNKLDRPVPAT